MPGVNSRRVARIEHWQAAEGETLVVVGWETKAPCGCLILEGVRTTPRERRGEPMVGAWSCSEPHARLLERFNQELVERIPEPERPLHDVVVERLAALNLSAHAA